MPCYHPLRAYKTAGGQMVFKLRGNAVPLMLACGSCIGCRIERSRQWAVRILHESQLHENNCFITLTYSPEHLPFGGTLIKKDFQDFMKRLRRRLGCRKGGRQISFFHCGEYGEKFRRPHYHAVIFGWDPDDKMPLSRNSRGDMLYTSKLLSATWTAGFASVGAVTFESAAYCARYVCKKVTGEKARAHYENIDQWGEIHNLLPEYITMSLKPAIGKGWIDKFASDVYPDDFCVIRGKKMKPPRYYDKQLSEATAADIKAIRAAFAVAHEADATRPRLAVREAVKVSQLKQLKRVLE